MHRYEVNAKRVNSLIMEYIKDTNVIILSDYFLTNGMHMIDAMKSGKVLEDEDEIKLVPFLSGG